MMRSCNPAMTITRLPAIAIRAAVPRSGCSATSPTGTNMSMASTASELTLGGSARSCKNQAHIIGTASFMTSEGWKRSTPKSSQRCAPLPM